MNSLPSTTAWAQQPHTNRIRVLNLLNSPSTLSNIIPILTAHNLSSSAFQEQTSKLILAFPEQRTSHTTNPYCVVLLGPQIIPSLQLLWNHIIPYLLGGYTPVILSPSAWLRVVADLNAILDKIDISTLPSRPASPLSSPTVITQQYESIQDIIPKINQQSDKIHALHCFGSLGQITSLPTTISPSIILSTTQPGPSVCVLDESVKIPDICSKLAQILLARLNASVPGSSPLNPLTSTTVCYVHESVLDSTVSTLHSVISNNPSPAPTQAMLDQQQTLIDTACNIYGTPPSAILSTNGVNIIKTVHWASSDLGYVSSPSILMVSYRHHTELLNFLQTSTNVHSISFFGSNISSLYELAHHSSSSVNTVLINAFIEDHINTNSLIPICPQQLALPFAQNKEVGILHPYAALNQSYVKYHNTLSQQPNLQSTSPQKQQSKGYQFPLIGKKQPTTSPSQSDQPFSTLSLSNSTAHNNAPTDRTVKQFIGGKQCRSEGEYTTVIPLPTTQQLQNQHSLLVPSSTRKDLRDAIEAAVAGFQSWSKTSAFLKSQLIYYFAENLMTRYADILSTSELNKMNEIVLQFAACADKFGGLIHSVVAGTELVNVAALKLVDISQTSGTSDQETPVEISLPEQLPIDTLRQLHYTLMIPHGIVVLHLSASTSFLAFLTLLFAQLCRGNAVIVLFHIQPPTEDSQTQSWLTSVQCFIDFYQLIETTKLPAGTINILFSDSAFSDCVKSAFSHKQVNQVVAVVDSLDELRQLKGLIAPTCKHGAFFTHEMLQAGQYPGDLFQLLVQLSSTPRSIIVKK